MAMAYRTSVAGGANSNAAVPIVLTPVLGDLIVIGAVETGHDAIGAASVTDNRGGTYRLVKTQVLNVHLDGVASVWVRESLLTLSDDPTLANVTVTYTPDPSATGSEVVVVAVSGFAAFDTAAIRQSVSANGAAAASVTASFAAATLTGDLTMSFVGCLTNPPGLTATASWTRRQNVGQATPLGLTVQTRDSGFVGTAITWGTTAPSSFAIINIELDGNAISSVNPSKTLATVVSPVGVAGWRATRQQYVMPQRPRRESSMLAIAATQNVAKTVTVLMRGIGSDLGIDGLAASLVVQLKKFGGAYVTIAPVITARGGGVYDIALTAGNLDTLGMAALRVSLASALVGIEMVVTNDDTLIDVVVSAGTGEVNVVAWKGSVPTSLDAAGNVPANVLEWKGSTPSSLDAAGNLPSNVQEWEGVVPSALQTGFVQAAAQAISAGSTDAIAIAVLDKALVGHTGAGTVGGAINSPNIDTNAIAVAVLDKALVGHTGAGTVGGALNNIPTAAQVATAVLDAARSGHLTVGSIGEGIALATSLLQGNFFIDEIDNTNPNGPISQRLRCFVNAAAMAGVTPGGTGQGEFATFLVTTTYVGPNKIDTHKVVQQ